MGLDADVCRVVGQTLEPESVAWQSGCQAEALLLVMEAPRGSATNVDTFTFVEPHSVPRECFSIAQRI